MMEEIEIDLELQGASAVEDKLQDEVGETVSFLLDVCLRILWITSRPFPEFLFLS